MKYSIDRPLTEAEVEQNRAERIFKERVSGKYVELGRLTFQKLVEAQASGKSLANVKNMYGTPATKEMLKGVGRNDECPCKSGRKAKYCCL